jgi:dihydrofolate synthase/folylpolyglutamate synthase
MHTLNDWLKKIEQPVENKKDFACLLQLAKNLQVDKTHAKVITVTGTNGKGSCVEMLNSVYVDAGYLVGTYTSPHLFSFNERVRIQKKPVEDSLLCEAFRHVEIVKADIELTYFEWVTLAALWIFKQLNLNVIILEVGIGGRLDATNILDADLAIIVSIGLDHMEYLGYTREAIAQEKAGICRQNQKAVCGDSLPPQTLKQIVQQLGTHMTYVGQDFSYELKENSWSFYNNAQKVTYKNLPLPILAVNNAAVCWQSILLINDCLPVNISKAIQSIITTRLVGRCELRLLSNGATAILDVSHNPQAAVQLYRFLQPYSHKKIIALFSMLHDKDIEGTIANVKELISEWHVVEMDHPRRASNQQLNEAFEHHNLTPILHEDWANAVSFIKDTMTKDDVVVIFGSFFVVSAVVPLL